jgi:hypothetical protein
MLPSLHETGGSGAGEGGGVGGGVGAGGGGVWGGGGGGVTTAFLTNLYESHVLVHLVGLVHAALYKWHKPLLVLWSTAWQPLVIFSVWTKFTVVTVRGSGTSARNIIGLMHVSASSGAKA